MIDGGIHVGVTVIHLYTSLIFRQSSSAPDRQYGAKQKQPMFIWKFYYTPISGMKGICTFCNP